ncbi:MAG TPA: 5-dehydro-4-deoxy-D-glucuronate isomerase [Mucilaginibacter sp.]
MKVLHAVHPDDFKRYDTSLIRERFLMKNLVRQDQVNCVYTHYDRLVIGAANPVNDTLELKSYPNLRADYFLERREIGVINVAGGGTVTADGQNFKLNKLDCLYIGKGVKDVTFSSDNSTEPAVFYLLSAPAHKEYPTALISIDDAAKVEAGHASTANRRTINKYIHAEGVQSCQLVLGLTALHPGSVWNTMPPHTHDRRTEAYFYFDIPAGQRIVHYMGEGNETRHVLMNNYDAIVSPPWSIHSGSGTSNYNFIWGMAGENLNYTDMDMVAIEELR